MKFLTPSQMRERLPAIAAVLSGLIYWEGLVRILHVQPYVLPAPSAILALLVTDGARFWTHAAITLAEACAGLMVAIVCGAGLGFLTAFRRPLSRALVPLIVAIQAVPIIAFAPILILWLGAGMVSKAAMAGLLCFFPMAMNTMKGVGAIPQGALDMIRLYRIPRDEAFVRIAVPYSMPYVLAGAKVSASMAIIGAIVAEYAGANAGLGYLIMQATYRVETTEMFAAIACSALAAWGLYACVALLEGTVYRRFTQIS